MARTTDRDLHDVRPRPLGQSLWLLATVVMAAIILSAVGESLSVAEGTARTTSTSITGQELLELASATRSSGPSATIPASPTITSALHAPIPTGEQARGQAALATISYPWRDLLPGWTISFLPERDGLYGLTLVPEERIEIYVRPGQTTDFLAHVIAHELGHAVDVTLNDGPDRRLWETSRGLESSPWWPGDGATDFSTGAGDFAESFAAWQVGSGSFRSDLADPPSPQHLALLAELSAG